MNQINVLTFFASVKFPDFWEDILCLLVTVNDKLASWCVYSIHLCLCHVQSMKLGWQEKHANQQNMESKS